MRAHSCKRPALKLRPLFVFPKWSQIIRGSFDCTSFIQHFKQLWIVTLHRINVTINVTKVTVFHPTSCLNQASFPKCPRTRYFTKCPIKYNLYVISLTVKLSKPNKRGITVRARCYHSMKKMRNHTCADCVQEARAARYCVLQL